MKIWSIVVLLTMTLMVASCNSGMEYIPCSTVIVKISEDKTTFELKLDQEQDWDRVSKCIWTVDGKEVAAKGRSVSLPIDRSTSHVFECTLYVGENLWCSFVGECPRIDSYGNLPIKEIESTDLQ